MLKRWKIAKLLYVSFFLMLILPIFLVTLFSVRSFNHVLLQNMTSRAMQTLEQVSYTVDSHARRIINTVATIANDEEVIAGATRIHQSSDVQQQFEYSQKLDHQLYNYFHYTSDIISVLFFYNDSGMYYSKQDMGLNEASLREMDWYRYTKQHEKKVQLFGAEDNLSVISNGDLKSPPRLPRVTALYFTMWI